MKRGLALLGCLAVLACDGEQQASQAQPAVDSPRTMVDSVFPVEEEIRRFKAARNGVSAGQLTGGATTRDALVQTFIKALEAQDTAMLRGLVLNAGEFIDLYYPSSMFAAPPYKQSPELRWFLIQENSNKGFHRLLQRYGGKETGFTGYDCAPQAQQEGVNRIWDRCTVAWALQPSPLRVFSTIIERAGRFKFISYANDL